MVAEGLTPAGIVFITKLLVDYLAAGRGVSSELRLLVGAELALTPACARKEAPTRGHLDTRLLPSYASFFLTALERDVLRVVRAKREVAEPAAGAALPPERGHRL